VVSALVARAVAHVYPGGVQALDGVDLHGAPGDVLALIGPNGSGKSTLLRVLGGTLTPTRGTVELDARPLARLSGRARARRIASVPQSLRSLPDARVLDFVCGGRYAHVGFWSAACADDRRAVEQALAEAGLSELCERRVSELSGGQRQRALLALALAQQPDILLFDEPTTALDPEHQVRFFERARALAESGRMVVVATHDLNLASLLARRLVLLAGGQIAAQGTAREVLRPEVLVPVYGPTLLFLEARAPWSTPLVLSWPRGPG
jgi:iron complex transport system ATP-binding protein